MRTGSDLPQNPNQNSSACSDNEFITQDEQNLQQNQMQKMFAMFQKMATDPNMFMKMMGSVQPAEEPKSKPPSTAVRERQFQIEQHKYRNHEVSPRRNPSESLPIKKQSRKKGANLLDNYLPDQSSNQNSYEFQNQPLAESRFEEEKIMKKKKSPSPPLPDQSFEQPNLSVRPKEPHYVNPYDEIPIKSKYVEHQQMKNEELEASRLQSAQNVSKYVEQEQRPITGIKGDFKAYLENIQGVSNIESLEQYASQDNHDEADNEEQEKVAPTRTFLKRNSRQYLSSAKDKSVAKKKPAKASNQNHEKSMEYEEKGQRSVSQNRVLAGKTKTPAKPAPKKPAQQNNGDKSPRNNANKVPNNNIKSSIVKREEEEFSPSFKDSKTYESLKKSPAPPQQPVKKKKNIFQRDSSSDSEHGQTIGQEQNFNKTSRSSISEQKHEVVPGILLTNKQLYQIINKYGNGDNLPSQHKNDSKKSEEQRQMIKELKNKYIDLCNVLTEEKRMFEEEMEKEKNAFELYKQGEMAKIKNERKVQERNMLASKKDKESAKEREEFEALRKEVEKEREEYKKKDKNSKIIIEKYKKEVEELKSKLANVSQANQTQSNIYNPFPASENSKKSSAHQPVVQEQVPAATKEKLPNYNDLKKKTKFQYHEEKPQTRKSEANGEIVQQRKEKSKNYFKDDSSASSEEKSKNKLRFKSSSQQSEKSQGSENEGDQEEIVEYNPSMKISDLNKIPLSIKMVTKSMVENLFKSFAIPEYKIYKDLISGQRNKIHTSKNAIDRKTTNIYSDGGKQVIFETGVRKEYFSNGYSIIFFPNGDIKQKLADETILYFYKEKEVDQITLPNKTNIYRFENNQVEFHFPDGHVQIRHPDGSFKVI